MPADSAAPTSPGDSDVSSLEHALLQASTPAQRLDLLRQHIVQSQQPPSDALSEVLDIITRWLGARTQPAHDWAEVIAHAATAEGLPGIAAHADYLRARICALGGDFDKALTLIDAAQQGHARAGQPLDALRTQIGRIHVLKEIGRYQDALGVARAVLDHLAQHADNGPADTRLLLGAMAQHNSGVCYEQMGQYEPALAAYDAALSAYTTLGADQHVADIINNRGVVLLHLGQIDAALGAFAHAAETFAAEGLTVQHAMAITNSGYAHSQLDDHVKGLAAFQTASQILADAGADAERLVVQLDLAEAYLALNLLSEADAAFHEVLTLTLRSGMRHERARAFWGLGGVLASRGDTLPALRALDEAMALFDAAGNQAMRCRVQLHHALLLARLNRHAEAAASVREVATLAAQHNWPLQRAEAHLQLAEFALRAGAPDSASADAELQAARPWVRQLNLPRMSDRLGWLTGHLAEASGDVSRAEAEWRAVIDSIEQRRDRLDSVALRASFFEDKLTVHDDLMQLLLRQKATTGQIFDVAERAKSRTLVDLLHGIGPANSAVDPIGHPLSAGAICAQLAGNENLLSFSICRDEVLAFVLSQHHEPVLRRLGPAKPIRDAAMRLDMEWRHFQMDDSFVSKHIRQLELSVHVPLRALYDALLRPLEDVLRAGAAPGEPQRLIIAPNGPLHSVPFHALFDGAQHVLDWCELSYAPSATAWALGQTRDTGMRSGRRVVFGVPDARIPAVRAECTQVADALGAELFLDGAATLAAFLSAAPSSDIVHVACHSHFRADNAMLSSLRLRDGALLAADVITLNLDGATVMLSACESGRSNVRSGDELMGLVRAFLGAGALRLVVSQWLVRDESTADLMTDLHLNRLHGASTAAALRAAQLRARERHAHPYYWAPFVLIGRRD